MDIFHAKNVFPLNNQKPPLHHQERLPDISEDDTLCIFFTKKECREPNEFTAFYFFS